MNVFVIEENENDELVSSSPLLLNFQTFHLSADEIKIKPNCRNCTQYSYAEKILGEGINELTPYINKMFNIMMPLDENGSIPGLFIAKGESKLITICGYDADKKLVGMSYFKVINYLDLAQRIAPIEGPICSAAMLNNHKNIQRRQASISFRTECFADGSYNASGFLEKEEGLYHVVYSQHNTTTGEESLEYVLFDLVNHNINIEDANEFKNYLTSLDQKPLKRTSITVASNLAQGGRDFLNYPEPKIFKDSTGKVVIAAITGEAKTLKIYSLNDNEGQWEEQILAENVINVSKLAFSKRKSDIEEADVLYYLKTDGKFYEYKLMGGMPMVTQEYTLTDGDQPIKDFSVDYNPTAEVTKFAFTKEIDTKRKLFLAKYQNNFTLNSFQVGSCNLAGNNISFDEKSTNDNYFDPVIKISNDGRAWFKVNTYMERLNSKNNPDSYVFSCKEDKLLENQQLQANGFNNTFSMITSFRSSGGFEENLNKNLGVGGDFVISQALDEALGDFHFFYLGSYWNKSAIFNSSKKLYRVSTSANFPLYTTDVTPIGLNGEFKINQNELSKTGTIGDDMNYFGDIKVDSIGLFDLLVLGNYYYVTDTGSLTKNFTCLSVSDSNINESNSYRDNYLGVLENSETYKNYDTDNDGIEDYFEVYLGLDPSIADSDSDGVSDLVEATAACSGN